MEWPTFVSQSPSASVPDDWVRLEKYLSVASVPLLCKRIMTSDSMNTIRMLYHHSSNDLSQTQEVV